MEASTSSTIEPETFYNTINNFFTNPTAFLILVLVVVVYLIFFLSLGGGGSGSADSTATNGMSFSSTMIFVIIGILLVLLLFNILTYFFSIDIVASIQHLFQTNPVLDITVNQNAGGISASQNIPEIVIRPQVFNIPGNTYGYEDAKTLCQAYGSRLATYDEVESTYNKGGEWCNYGWSDGQMALFPTQKNTYNTLQGIPGHEHDCGRPGVNGGYIANPRVKFGVNCYGYKPRINSEEEEMMQNTTPYPKTEKDLLFEKRVDYWKSKLDQILVSPFNYDTWSRI